MLSRKGTVLHPVETHTVKLLILGAASVGKSSLLLRFTDQQWLPENEAQPTVGVDNWVSRQMVYSSVPS
jgi:GTPase SAR1 family protein